MPLADLDVSYLVITPLRSLSEMPLADLDVSTVT